MRMLALVVVAAALAACSPKAPESAESVAPSAAPETKMAAPATDAWLGKWIGVEGNVLTIDVGAAPGVYAITEGTLDGEKHFTGTAAGETISLGGDGVIRAGTGADTGLKWLADKTNCLIIESGRGFCR